MSVIKSKEVDKFVIEASGKNIPGNNGVKYKVYNKNNVSTVTRSMVKQDNYRTIPTIRRHAFTKEKEL